MGEYVYKVTAKKKTLADGTVANVAVFAYKPSWDQEFNRRCEWSSSCHIADRYVATSKNYTGLCVLGESGEDAIPVKYGSFSDGWFSRQVSKKREGTL